MTSYWCMRSLKHCKHDQVFPWQVLFACSCAQQQLIRFSLTRSLVQKLVTPTFEPEKLFRVYERQGKLCHSRKCAHIVVKENLSSRTHEQTKLVKEKLREKTCSLYTRASKATKELVNESLVVCIVCGA